MALSYVNYSADGNTTQFALTFGYLRRSHVFVFVDNNLAAFKWVSGTNIEITPAPALGQEVRIQRLTDKVNRITDFADGQTLLAGDLDAATLQNFYLAQEMLDGITDGVLQGDVILNQPLAATGEPLTLQQVQTYLDEAARNSPVIEQLLGDTQVNAQSILDETQARLAAVSQETTDRIAAIAAEAQDRQTALQAEANARAAEVAGLQTQIDADVANLAATSNALTQEITDRIAAVAGVSTALAQEVSDRQAAVQTNADGLAAEILARQTEDSALDSRVDAVVATAGANSALIATETQARIDGDTALSTQLTAIQSSVDGNASQIASEITARTSADLALTASVDALTTRVGTNEADIITVNEAVSTEASARATAISGLQTQVDSNAASILSNATAISNETSARASAVSALQAQIDTNAAGITSEQNARISADASIASDVTALTTRMGTAEANIISANNAISTESSARATAISGLQTQVDSANALIASNTTAITDEEGTRASQFDSLKASQGASTKKAYTPAAGTGFLREEVTGAPEAGARAAYWSVGSSPVRFTAPGTGSSHVRFVSDDVIPLIVGSTIRWRIKHRLVGAPAYPNPTGPEVAVYFQMLATDHTRSTWPNPSGLWQYLTPSYADDGWVTTEIVWTVYQSALDAGAAFVRPSLITRYVSAVPAGASLEVEYSQLEVTGLEDESLQAAISSETSARVSADTAIASDVTALTTRMGDAEADIVTNQTAISDETSARASAISGLQTQIDGNAAAVTSEQSARVSADNAIASDLSGLTTRMGDAEADIVSNSTAISDETSARTSQFNALSAALTGGGNLLHNADFNLDGGSSGQPLGWNIWNQGSNSTSIRDETASGGSWYLGGVSAKTWRIEKTDGNQIGALDIAMWSIPVKPGSKYIASAYTGCHRCTGRVAMQFYDAEGNGLSTLLPTVVLNPATRVGGRNIDNFLRTYTAGIAPAGAAYATFYIRNEDSQTYNLSTYSNSVVFAVMPMFEEVSLEQSEPSPWSPGAGGAAVEARVVEEETARVAADAAIASDVSSLTTRMGDAEAGILTNASAITTESSARATEVSNLEARMASLSGGRVTLDDGADAFTVSSTGAPSTGSPSTVHWDFVSVATEGVVARQQPENKGFVELQPRVAFSASGEKRLRARLRIRVIEDATNGGGTDIGLRFRSMDENYVHDGFWGTVSATDLTVADGWQELETDIYVSDAATPTYFRPQVYVNWRGDAPVNGDARYEISEFDVEEITDTVARITTESDARVSADAAIASDVSGLTTRMGDAEADIITNATAISDEESARVSQFNSLSASMVGGGNLLKNSGFLLDTGSGVRAPDGWSLGGPLTLTASTRRTDTWELKNSTERTWYFTANDFDPSKYREMVSTPVPCQEGERLVASAYTGAHRCHTRVYVFFYDQNNAWLGTGVSPTTVANNYEKLGGTNLSGWKRVSSAVTAPANAVYCKMSIRMTPITNSSGWTDFYMFVTRPMLEKSSEVTKTAPSPWSPGNGEATGEAMVQDEASVRASADTTQASDISALTTRMGDAEADIVTNASAITTESSSRATEVKKLSARLGAASASFPAQLGYGEFCATHSEPPETVADLSASDWGWGSEGWGRYFLRQGNAGLRWLMTKAKTPLVQGRRYRMRVVARYRGTDFNNADPGHISIFFRTSTTTHGYLRAQGFKTVKFTSRWDLHEFETSFIAQSDEAWARPGLYTRDDCTLTDYIDIISIDVEEESASITEVRDVLADSNGDFQALYSLRTDVNGHISGFGLTNDGNTSEFAILADSFKIARTGPQGGPVGLFSVQPDGTVAMQNAVIGGALIQDLTVDKLTAGTINVDVTVDGLLEMGQGKITFDNGVYMKVQGVAFGANSDLIEWYGPKMAISSCTKGNAIYYLDTSGNAVFSGNVQMDGAAINTATIGTLQLEDRAAVSPDYQNFAGAGPWQPREYYTNTTYQPWQVNKFELPLTKQVPGKQLEINLDYDFWFDGNSAEFYCFHEKIYLVPVGTNITSTSHTSGLVRARRSPEIMAHRNYGQGAVSTEASNGSVKLYQNRTMTTGVVLPADADTVDYKVVFVWHLDRTDIPYSNGNQYGLKNPDSGSGRQFGIEDLDLKAIMYLR